MDQGPRPRRDAVGTLAQRERQHLADLFDLVGPDAATLCDGWSTRDLAAHLVLREGHPAAMGVAFPPAAAWTERTQRRLAAGDYRRLVERFRTGPPVLSPMRLPGLDRSINTFEHFVHHEDVRRADPHWQRRALGPADQQELWERLRRLARWYLRSAPVPVHLVSPGFGGTRVGDDGEPVTVSGPPAELVMYIHGRREHSVVVVSGADEVVDIWARHVLAV
jgi:uncharacterized protein (TIGR03085 family)